MVKNDWSYTSPLPIRLHGLGRNKFIFHLQFLDYHRGKKYNTITIIAIIWPGLAQLSIEPRGAAAFSPPVQKALGFHPASCTMGKGYPYQWVKRPGRGFAYRPPFIAEVKERAEIYCYSSSGF
jgi:hypothetical protein